ncbi:ABC transporter substrate-binding protein [Micromonospora sp. NPDC006766]|uniref:ABC transporter substrate-binding protein n=1 Tax=Micromonospora sp. NPDC006766 TaxID=3154778 RepID=UPI003410AE5C
MTNPGVTRTLSRRGLLAGAGAGLLGLGLSACGGNPDALKSNGQGDGGSGNSKQLVVFDGGGAWGAAQRKAFFEPFERETGIKVIPAPAPPAAQLRTAIASGKPGMDVVDLNGARIGSWTRDGLLQKIDYSLWKNPGLKDAFAPYPALETAVPAIVFAVQLAYDRNLTGRELTNWADLWDATVKGKRSFRTGDGPGGCTLEIALLADGVKPEDLYPLDMDRALRKLSEIKPRVLKFWDNGAESIQMLVDKQISAVAAWNGRIQSAIADGAKNISSTFEQAMVQIDYWAIPKGCSNVEGATRFIEFASEPQRQAEFAQLITYAPTIPSAFDHIPEERQKLLVTAPGIVEKTVLQNTDYWSSIGAGGKTNEEIAIDRWQKWLAG